MRRRRIETRCVGLVLVLVLVCVGLLMHASIRRTPIVLLLLLLMLLLLMLKVELLLILEFRLLVGGRALHGIKRRPLHSLL